MISNYSKLIAATATICVSPAHAREVDLARFAPADVAVSDENGSVGVALRTNLQSLAELAGAYSDIEKTETINLRISSRLLEREYQVVRLTSASSSCLRNGYLSTWWLPAEVEKRRAIYFETMSEIACENGLPVNLLDAVIAQESGYKAWAISGAGAIGMMQVMPGTARQLELWNPWDALANMRAGARYLRQQLDRFGRVDLALAAYNAGPERRSLAMGYVPAIPETRNYVRTITTNWLRLTQLTRSDPAAVTRAVAASNAVRAFGYREVSLITTTE